MLGLLGATYEMLAFKDDYPKQVIAQLEGLRTRVGGERHGARG